MIKNRKLSQRNTFYISVSLLSLFFLSFAMRMSLAPYVKEIIQFYQVDYAGAGLLTSSFLLGYGVLRLPAGWAADIFPPRQLIIGGLGLTSLSCLTFLAVGSHYIPALFAWLMVGAGAAALYSPAVKLLAEVHGPQQHGFVFGGAQTSIGMGMMFGLAVMPTITGEIHWRWGFLLYPSLAALLAVSNSILLGDHKSPHKIIRSSLAHRTGPKKILFGPVFLVAAAFLTFFGPFGMTSWLPTFLRETRDLTISQAGLVTALVSLFHACSGPFAGKLADILGSRTPVYVLGSAAVLGSFALVTMTDSYATIIAAAVCLGAGFGTVATILLLLAVDIGGTYHAGKTSGILGTVGQISSAISVAVIGAMLANNLAYHAAWVLCAIASALALALFLVSIRFVSSIEDH